MSSFNLAIKILQIKTKTNEDLLAYVAFPFNDETATQYEIESNSKRFREIGFGSKYHCFYPNLISNVGGELSFNPWLPLTSDQWITISVTDCFGAVPIDAQYENQFIDYLTKLGIDVDATVKKYMLNFNIVEHTEVPEVIVSTYNRPLLPGKKYVLDATIPNTRTLH